MIKYQLRKAFLAQRRLFNPLVAKTYTTCILQQLQRHPAWIAAKTVGAYMPIAGEITTAPLFHTDKKICLPRIGRTLEFCQFNNSCDLVPHPPLGILEPPATALVIPATQLDLFLLPIVAFTPQGYRLGLGKGHYDTFFQQTACQGFKIGLAYSWQRAYFPQDSWDIALDLIITEEGWVIP